MKHAWRDAFGNACFERRESVLPIGGSESLRDLDEHQTEAMDAIVDAIETTKNRAFALIHSTGSGKTTLEANILGASQEAKIASGLTGDRKDIIITTERALVSGVLDEIQSLGIDAGIWGRGKKQLDRPVVVASIQALQHNAKKLLSALPIDRTDLVIGDEADLYLTQKRHDVISQFTSSLRVGFTATETWPDGRTVSDVWGEKIHELTLDEAILKGVNVPPFFHLFEARLSADSLRIKGGDYDQTTLEAGMKAAEIEKAIPEVYRTLIPRNKRKDFPTLVYVPSVSLVEAVRENLEKELGAEGVRIAAWTGATKTAAMEEETLAFKIGNLDILVLCEIGGRGLDLVRARCLIDAYPTLSRTKLAQRHGRVLRTAREGSLVAAQGFQKPFALLAQIVPHANTFRPVCFPDLLEDSEAWNDAEEGRLLLTERRNFDRTELGQGRTTRSDIDEIREWIKTHRKTVQVTKIEEMDVFSHLKQRSEFPQAKKDGFIEHDGERYGTTLGWENVFGINYATIQKRLANIGALAGKDAMGRMRDFFPESIVREKCADLLSDTPIAVEKGFIEQDGEQYGTKKTWTKALGIDFALLRKRLEKIIPLKRKVRGRMRDFFSERIVREQCADLLVDRPIATEKGFIEHDGERYGMPAAWERVLGISYATIRKRLANINALVGKDILGKMRDFFPESIVREKCADLIANRQPKTETE